MARRTDTYKLQIQLSGEQERLLKKASQGNMSQFVMEALAAKIPEFPVALPESDWQRTGERKNYPRQAVERLQGVVGSRGTISYRGKDTGQAGYYLNDEHLGSTESRAFGVLLERDLK